MVLNYEKFEHFDGAVREHSKKQLDERHCITIDKFSTDLPYKKLFRIDGNIVPNRWKQLLSLYRIQHYSRRVFGYIKYR